MADDTGHDGYNGSALVITSVTFLVLTWLSVLLRTYVRGFLTKSFQLDDWLMLVAQVCTARGSNSPGMAFADIDLYR